MATTIQETDRNAKVLVIWSRKVIFRKSQKLLTKSTLSELHENCLVISGFSYQGKKQKNVKSWDYQITLL